MIEEKLLKNLREAGNISLKNMAEYALKGQNMATKRSVTDIEINNISRGDVEYD